MDFEALGTAVRRARLQRELTQQQLASACLLSRMTISQVEAGSFSDLGIRKLDRLLAYLGLELAIVAATADKTHGRRPSSRVAQKAGTTGARRGMPSRIGRLLLRRAAARKQQAAPLVQATLASLQALGVRAHLVGSMATGRFRQDSDVDYLIEHRGALAEDEILAAIERAMKGFPFDVMFQERVAPGMRRFVLQKAHHGTPAVRQT